MSLSKFHFWCQKVLPLVYDDSLSYYEVLCKVTNYLNTTIEAVNEVSEKITNYDDSIADLNTKYSTLTSDIASLTTTVSNNYATVNKSLAELQTRINNNEISITSINGTIALLQSADETLQDTIDNLALTVSNNYNTLEAKINSLEYDIAHNAALAELRTAVKELQDKMNNLTYDVYNYALNARVSFDRNNWALYEHLGNGLTAEQYCTLGLSADDYADYDMRAIDYIKFSRDLLHYDWAYVPVKGGRQSHSNALSYLANLYYQTMSASDYANLDLDADGYADLDLTATQYLYYPISDNVALSPFQYMVMLNNERVSAEARIETLENDNMNLSSTVNDMQTALTELQDRVSALFGTENTVYISSTGTGITADEI